jgi:hypothetical protein
MSESSMMPAAAATSINDLLENAARVRPGEDVLLIAHTDGLYGGDNLVDREAIDWIQAAVRMRGANASVLWINESARPHAWRFPPVVKAAMRAADVSILHSFDITFEEIVELKQFVFNDKIRLIRNLATTAPLLCSAWARTPHELVTAIRYQATLPIKEGADWQLTDPNGTHLEGKIRPAFNENHPWFSRYSMYREEGGGYIPWPEWVVTPIRVAGVNGCYVFDRMLSWWSRYIGVSPYFMKAIRLSIIDGKIKKIEGGEDAIALEKFLAAMGERLGESVYDFNCFHFGVHPQAIISPQECPNILYRRLIEHAHSTNLHAHIGSPSPTEEYPYWMHITGDIDHPTFKVGDHLVYDSGHLTVLDSPEIKTITAKYPGRPGLAPEPRRF